MELSKKIVLARRKLGLTQEELASLAQVTVRTIQRIESGESIPRSFTVKALARALETNFEELTKETQNGGWGKSTGIASNQQRSGKRKTFPANPLPILF